MKLVLISCLVILGIVLAVVYIRKYKEHYGDPIKTRRRTIHLPSRNTHDIRGKWPNSREFVLDEYMSGTLLAEGKEIASVQFQGMNAWSITLKGTRTGIVIKAKDKNTIDFGAGILWKRQRVETDE